ncbi:Ger(x)C family spore germination protein [Neobacillus pocheonensis]|uniref:Ger(X)C family spore germination protein n=1 Tax=Neobacillus pocheonensis TaxID=363869 RepID=A0ABT0W8V7_9BACI|nr:Ger(x)C family spore germination protein [Neobacillus pocheonensis]
MIILLIPLLVNGCSFKDIDKRSFVTSIGIDKSELLGKKFKVILKISLSKGDPATIGADFTLLSFDANSISEALRRMKSMTDKELFYGHTKTILIGEKVAKRDIRPLLDYFVRRPEIHKTAYLSVAAPTAYQVLQYKPKEERVAGSYLFSMFEESSSDAPYVKALTLFDAYRRETETGINIAMPVIEVQNNKILVDTIALFSKKRMKSKLNPRESELFRLLTVGIKNGSTNIKTQDGTYAINILKGNASYKIKEAKNNMLSAFFLIKLNAIVEEKMDNQINLSDDQIKIIQDETEKKMKKEVNILLDNIQKTKLDPIGLGLKFNSKNFDHRNWDNFYSNLKFNVNVTCKINGTGIVE